MKNKKSKKQNKIKQTNIKKNQKKQAIKIATKLNIQKKSIRKTHETDKLNFKIELNINFNFNLNLKNYLLYEYVCLL